MRKRTLIGAGVAASGLLGAAIAGGMTAFAEPQSPTPSTESAAAPVAVSGTVVLPTGDTVTVLPGGATTFLPADGREDIAFLTPRALDGSGDAIVVPSDMAEAIEDGDEDPRRYNVSQLLRDGHADAAAVPESELDTRAYDGLVPAAEATRSDASAEQTQTFTVTIKDRSGNAPESTDVLWVNLDDGNFDGLEIGEDGTGKVELAPGTYAIVSEAWNEASGDEHGEWVTGMTSVVVGDEPAELLIDGAEAAPVSVEVDRSDAELYYAELNVMAIPEAEDESGLYSSKFLPAAIDSFLMPSRDIPGMEMEMLYKPTLLGAEAEEPFEYNLAIAETDGIPQDLEYAVADGDLAVVETDFQTLGVDTSGTTCSYGDTYPVMEEQLSSGFCIGTEKALPSSRTMLYTADPRITWNNGLTAGTFDEAGDVISGFNAVYTEIMQPGTSERTVVHGPLSPGASEAGRYNEDGRQLIAGYVWPGSGYNGEVLHTVGYTGSTVLSRDGAELGRTDDMNFYNDNFVFELPEGDAGRYTLTAEATRDDDVMLFGTESTMEWTFDSAPVEESTEFVLPVVSIEAEGTEGGYAERSASQDIALELIAYETLPEPTAEDLTFEVSYDDGATWTAIELDRDGNTATATLDHPDDAEFVSVRMTALDDAGTEVALTTIRSYGLR